LYAGRGGEIPVTVKIQTEFSIDPFDGFITNSRNQFMLCPELIHSITVQSAFVYCRLRIRAKWRNPEAGKQ